MVHICFVLNFNMRLRPFCIFVYWRLFAFIVFCYFSSFRLHLWFLKYVLHFSILHELDTHYSAWS